MRDIRDIITKEIQFLIQDFEEYPDRYITEEDVRSFLVAKLLKYSELSTLQDTADGSKSIPLHTEARWYGASRKLKWRSDIVVMDVSSLVTKDGIIRVPSKGYAFSRTKAIIEVKLRRVNGGSDRKFIERIRRDIDKLKEIKGEVIGDYSCFLVVLDKKSNIQARVNDVERGLDGTRANIRIYYKYSPSTSVSYSG